MMTRRAPPLALAALLFCAAPIAGFADIIAERGDRLLVSVAEAPEIGRDAKVGLDGRIMLPALGGIPAAGRSLDDIRTTIEDELKARKIILRPTVLVDVSTYRPFYVGGAVAHPAAIPFEPGLIVRNALVLAGGVQLRQEASAVTPSQVAELAAKGRASAYELFQVDSRIARVQAALAGSETLDAKTTNVAGIDKAAAAQVTQIDTSLLLENYALQKAQQDNIQKRLDLVDFQIDVLGKQAAQQLQEENLQQNEVNNARDLVSRGLLPLPRLQELQREVSRQKRDFLENQAFAAQARQNRQSVLFEQEESDTKWRLSLQVELRDALQQKSRLEADVAVYSNQLNSLGLALKKDGTLAAPEPRVVIHRSTNGEDRAFQANMETAIEPGDILDVTLEQGVAG